MKFLITNLSKQVANEALQHALATRLDRLSPGRSREQAFGSIVGRTARALDLRAVVEFLPDKTWATFTDLRDQPAVSFSLEREENQ